MKKLNAVLLLSIMTTTISMNVQADTEKLSTIKLNAGESIVASVTVDNESVQRVISCEGAKQKEVEVIHYHGKHHDSKYYDDVNAFKTGYSYHPRMGWYSTEM